MKTSTNVIAAHSFTHTIERDAQQLPSLKHDIAALCGGRVRRVDRYIELCLAGALRCVAGHQLPADTAVYLATRSGAVETSSQATRSIVQLQQAPKPLHFVNTLGNTACFYLTRSLGVHGQALVVSQEHLSFEAALFQASIDLALGVVDTALVGGIDEVTLPVSQHATRLDATGSEPLLEGSHWVLLSRSTTTTDMAPLAKPLATLSRPQYHQDLQTLLRGLDGPAPRLLQCSFAATADEQRIMHSAAREVVDASATARFGAVAHGVYSGAALVSLLERSKNEKDGPRVSDAAGSAVHVSRTNGSYCAVAIT